MDQLINPCGAAPPTFGQFYDDQANPLWIAYSSAGQTKQARPPGIDAALVREEPVNTGSAGRGGGTPAVGSTLTCTKGFVDWRFDARRFAYEWLRTAARSQARAASTYVVQTAERGDQAGVQGDRDERERQLERGENMLTVPVPPPSTTTTTAIATPAPKPEVKLSSAKILASCWPVRVPIACAQAPGLHGNDRTDRADLNTERRHGSTVDAP